MSEIKISERCFQCWSIEFCLTCNKCPNCCSRSTCRGKTTPVLGHKNAERRLHSPIPGPAKSDKVANHHKLLCQSCQKPLPDRGITCTCDQKCSRTGQNQKSLGFFNGLFLVPIQTTGDTRRRTQQSKAIPQTIKWRHLKQ